MRVRGLKLFIHDRPVVAGKSHPVRVRGLKLIVDLPVEQNPAESHPVRVRGLKLVLRTIIDGRATVAPRAGAWIETPSV